MLLEVHGHLSKYMNHLRVIVLVSGFVDKSEKRINWLVLKDKPD